LQPLENTELFIKGVITASSALTLGSAGAGCPARRVSEQAPGRGWLPSGETLSRAIQTCIRQLWDDPGPALDRHPWTGWYQSVAWVFFPEK